MNKLRKDLKRIGNRKKERSFLSLRCVQAAGDRYQCHKIYTLLIGFLGFYHLNSSSSTCLGAIKRKRVNLPNGASSRGIWSSGRIPALDSIRELVFFFFSFSLYFSPPYSFSEILLITTRLLQLQPTSVVVRGLQLFIRSPVPHLYGKR